MCRVGGGGGRETGEGEGRRRKGEGVVNCLESGNFLTIAVNDPHRTLQNIVQHYNSIQMENTGC